MNGCNESSSSQSWSENRGPLLGQKDHAAVSGHITLVIGGARSGKSTWAEQRAMQSGRQVLYIATATAGDDEMTERIAVHQAQRPNTWRTVEEPENLLHAIQATATPGDAVVVDCLTLW